ncbi:hypothetical protein C8F01DRAFT_1153041 [Mycena amicta]|nr:hypothetical protein C8F01DRAFT_1153041 [Mycena amicta]
MHSVAQLLAALLVLSPVSLAAFPSSGDPCAVIAGKAFVLPADALACLKSFPFNETLRQNVLSHNIARVFDFFTFEDYYLNSPPPFQESTANIRAELARINTTKYATDYDFNWDLYNTITQLNDGHTRACLCGAGFPDCYTSFQNLAPAPIVSLEVKGVQGSCLGTNYTDLIKINWKRLAGAKVLSIQGENPYDYIDFIAKTVSGNYLDHGVRVNSVVSSYRLVGASYSQRFGDFAGPTGVAQNSISLEVIVNGSTKAESVTVPYIASFVDLRSWVNNCAANDGTNGVDFKNPPTLTPGLAPIQRRKQPIGNIVDKGVSTAVGLPPAVRANSADRGGTFSVGSFEGDFDTFQTDIASRVTQLIIDLTNNGGGFVCLGQFLHAYLAGSSFGYPGFQSTARANPLARKIVASDIELGLNGSFSFYTADNWAFFNGTEMPSDYNYMEPDVPVEINGKADATSQRFHDTCELSFDVPIPATPPFDLKWNVDAVSNGNCASTCAMFSTLMFERHQTKVAIFGGKPNEDVQYKGMAGNQVLEWFDIDSEVKTANLKNVSLFILFCRELSGGANFIRAGEKFGWHPVRLSPLLIVLPTGWRGLTFNFRTPSLPLIFLFPSKHGASLTRNSRLVCLVGVSARSPLMRRFAAYVSELPKLRFPYTPDTYNNPQNLWLFAEKQLF